MEELEEAVLEKVGNVIASINAAKHVDQVICALHSLAVLLFPVDSRSFIGSISEKYRDLVRGDLSPTESERRKWWEIFYKGPAFPTLARVLLLDVASNWLACFPISARKNVYDEFFVSGCMTEVVQEVVPFLRHRGRDAYDVSAVCSNAERLLVCGLVENNGFLQIAKELAFASQDKELTDQQLRQAVSRIVQLITSIPDKARPGASVSLSSHLFFDQIVAQLVHQAEDFGHNLFDEADNDNKIFMDSVIIFAGETFVRICRRGSADVLLNHVIPKVLGQVRSILSSDAGVKVSQEFTSAPGLQIWSKVVESMKDTYAIERMSEQLLNQLAFQNASDAEAHWILWLMFHQMLGQMLIRSMFVDKFLFWKVFPICCLRWILHFAVLESPPQSTPMAKASKSHGFLDMVQRLLVVWSKREFIQSATLERQAYITAALGLCLEKMSKEDLDATKNAIHSILEGVSYRLESPDHLIRKMASSIALAFSKVVDPQNPLYLDDSMHEDNVDWSFGLITQNRRSPVISHSNNEVAETRTSSSSIVSEKEFKSNDVKSLYNVRGRKKMSSEFKLVDPDEVIDPAILNVEPVSEEEDDLSSDHSETSSDSSLQPYDLADDDTDLKKKFSQLVDVVGALRKSDDPDSVENALDVTENLVRASPDELKYVAADLARTLVQVRCSDLTIDGEESSAEEKRQRALIALIVKCSLPALEALHSLLYSPNVDVSQRIMILDVMTEAALELSSTRTAKVDHHSRTMVSSISDQPWFIPRSIGPPGASPWKPISTPGAPLNWSYSYERELPSKPGHVKGGKTRRWNLHTPAKDSQQEWCQNEFPQHVAAFMLPAMKGFDKKSHGVDLLGRDFIVLGKLIYMLGVCIKCAAMHPEASVMASPLLDMLSAREISHHEEAYVRRSVLFAASCILVAVHPTYIASALINGNTEIARGLEWTRSWAHQVADSDTDKECYTLAMTCLQLHSEMALQTSRALESTDNTLTGKAIGLPSELSKGIIKIPFRNV